VETKCSRRVYPAKEYQVSSLKKVTKKEKKEQISKRRRYKMGKRFYVVLVLLGILFLMGTGLVEAGFDVNNRAYLLYYSNPARTFSYALSDTAVIRVLYGPAMRMAKYVQNMNSGETSNDRVVAARGDVIRFVIDGANDLPAADTYAHHVTIMDTFANLFPGDNTATVGPAASNSFTYVAGSETATNDNSFPLPNKIAYYCLGVGWQGIGGAVVNIYNPSDPNWITYASGRETTWGGSTDQIVGIAWYWQSVQCVRNEFGQTITGSKYMIRSEFRIQKNNN
jgi:hypothetical protein